VCAVAADTYRADGEVVQETGAVSAPGSKLRYDAFISYSHAADGKLAPNLRNGLLRFATPWRVFRWRNPVRALRIFQSLTRKETYGFKPLRGV
jgi:hypothetical protein